MLGKANKKRQKILLIDEIDVFFGKDFYGNLYSISAKVYDDKIFNFPHYLWEIKDQLKNKLNDIDTIRNSKRFIELVSNFKIKNFAEESVSNMIYDLINFDNKYSVSKDGIGYIV